MSWVLDCLAETDGHRRDLHVYRSEVADALSRPRRMSAAKVQTHACRMDVGGRLQQWYFTRCYLLARTQMQRGCMRKCENVRKSTRRASTALSTAVTRLTTRRAHIVQHIASHYTHLIAKVAGFVSHFVLGPIGITPTACMNHLSPPTAALTCHPLLKSGVLGAFLCEIVSVAVSVCLYSFPGVRCQI